MDWGSKWLVDFNAGKTQLVSSDQSNNTGAIDGKMDESVFEEKSSFKMFGLNFSSKLDWGSYITPFAKSASIKIGALIFSMKFLSPEIALYSINLPYTYACHIWVCIRSCCLELLNKLQKQIFRTVGPSLSPSLGHLAH